MIIITLDHTLIFVQKVTMNSRKGVQDVKSYLSKYRVNFRALTEIVSCDFFCFIIAIMATYSKVTIFLFIYFSWRSIALFIDFFFVFVLPNSRQQI